MQRRNQKLFLADCQQEKFALIDRVFDKKERLFETIKRPKMPGLI